MERPGRHFAGAVLMKIRQSDRLSRLHRAVVIELDADAVF
jgi:hypothetical protein